MFTKKLFLIAVSLSLILSRTTIATEVSYELEDLGSGQWICRYSITNDTLGEPVEQFIIWYEPWLYENLTVVSDPEIGYDWYQDTIEPDPIWLYYGAYRALAWGEGIGPGEYESGFAVLFTYLGPGIPGPQEFDIVDPEEYISLEAGWTIRALYVDDDAAGNPIQTGTSEYPFETIGLAVTAASDDYLIIVAPGEYAEGVNFQGKAITVKSSNPRDFETMNSTIINGRTSGSCAVFDSGEGNDSILEGFTLTDGKGQLGIAEAYFSPSGRVGGGILCLDSSPTIKRCNITSNAYRYSGECIEGSPRVEYGGGIALIGSCSAVVSNCFITDNSAEYGAGVVVRSEFPEDSASSIVNCTIANNLFYYDTPDYKRFEVDCKNTKVTIKNTIINNENDHGLITFDTTEITYSCIRDAYYSDGGYTVAVPYDLTPAGGNIDENPMFVSGQQEIVDEIDEGCVIDYESDCHLQLASPCLNAGDPAGDHTGQSDIDGYPRLMSGRVDIGADEIIPTIIVEKPTGGEVWAAGSSHPVEWSSYGVTGNVDIFYSINNGTDWNTIDSNTVDSGSYMWILPIADSNQCVAIVTATVEPDYIEYVSSGMFTILPYSEGTPVTSKWPTLGQNSQRDGFSSQQGPELGCVKWQYSTPAPVYTSTTVDANDQVHIACEDGLLYTVDADTGSELWSYDTGSGLLSAPSVGPDGTVYVGNNDGRLYAIDKDGQLRWTHDTEAFIFSTPAVADDGTVFAGSADGKVYALGPDGSELWSYEIDGPGQVPASILASPAIGGDGNVYIGGLYDSKLYALDPSDGSIVWTCNFERPDPCDPCSIISGSLFASPVVDANGIIYAGLLNDTSLHAIDPATGSILWSTELADTASGAFDEYPGDPCSFYNVGDSCWSEPVIGPDGTIYVNLDDPYLRALDPSDGSINWVSRIGMIGGFTMAVGNDGLIYAAGDDRQIHVINPAGEEVARFESTNWLSYPVIAYNGTVLLSDADNTVWAISAGACDSTTADMHRPADLTQDRTVNMPDFVMLAGEWLDCSDPGEFGDCDYTGDEIYLTGDVNIDMYINTDDLKIMAQYWLYSE